MDKQALVKRLAATKTKKEVLHLAASAEEGNLSVTLLHELCYHSQNTIAFRAAWILEHVAAHRPVRLLPIFEDFIRRLPDQRNRSCQRHFTKILMYVTGPKTADAYADAFRNVDRQRLVETVFGWLIDDRTPVAVQVNCMDVLLGMSKEFDWIPEELELQVGFLMRDGSPAIQSRGKKILYNLSRAAKSAG